MHRDGGHPFPLHIRLESYVCSLETGIPRLHRVLSELTSYCAYCVLYFGVVSYFETTAGRWYSTTFG